MSLFFSYSFSSVTVFQKIKYNKTNIQQNEINHKKNTTREAIAIGIIPKNETSL